MQTVSIVLMDLPGYASGH